MVGHSHEVGLPCGVIAHAASQNERWHCSTLPRMQDILRGPGTLHTFRGGDARARCCLVGALCLHWMYIAAECSCVLHDFTEIMESFASQWLSLESRHFIIDADPETKHVAHTRRILFVFHIACCARWKLAGPAGRKTALRAAAHGWRQWRHSAVRAAPPQVFACGRVTDCVC